MSIQGLTNLSTEEQKELELAKIDFKMVTFTLAGKDYGIDIMKVKEIHKAQKFTFVPNSAPFVKGVYNMRGDIISVIDLRVFFNLPVEENEKGFENMIILRLEDNTIGILVDSIEKVIGIDSSRKQPPHPLFGDINIKYIDGVVENDTSLYIILDAEKIFSNESQTDSKEEIKVAAQTAAYQEMATAAAPEPDKHVNQGFVEETLSTYLGFYPSPLNRDWISKRLDSWIKQRGENNFQLNNKEDAQEFLKGFYSNCSGQMWSDELLNAVRPLLPRLGSTSLVWNPGCGRGYETYSVTALLKNTYPETVLKVQGNDNDLISISSAPGLLMDPARISPFYKEYLVGSGGGSQFNEIIKDSIIFEYSDLGNNASLPPVDMIVCRDTLSYLPESTQMSVLDFMYENLKPGGILMLGDNESPINISGWQVVENNGQRLYKKS
ncbi:MAG: chemotaxis protein CheW [Spirochaetales bacterium]|nr:chemotaxis protein CheW [Spirochaetales bacterium]